jgi:hypothetical protein
MFAGQLNPSGKLIQEEIISIYVSTEPEQSAEFIEHMLEALDYWYASYGTVSLLTYSKTK